MSDSSTRRTSNEAMSVNGIASFRLGDHVLTPNGRPLVMGILNLTPDSFHSASQISQQDVAATARNIAAAGADMLDLGAESSRPGAAPISSDEEQARLLPALKAVRESCQLPVSVDTLRASTAAAALAAGADAINDISAGEHDPHILPLVAEHGAGLILMHKQGRPDTMQDKPVYTDVVQEITDYLAARADAALTAGVAADRILVDPGIGFGKTLAHNLALLANLKDIGGGRPLLLGASRKSFISHVCRAEVEQRLPGSLAAVAAAMHAGVAVVRVHDVAETCQFLDVLKSIDQNRDR